MNEEHVFYKVASDYHKPNWIRKKALKDLSDLLTDKACEYLSKFIRDFHHPNWLRREAFIHLSQK